MKNYIIIVFVVILSLHPVRSFAQTVATNQATYTDQSIRIDAILDEEVWLNGDTITGFKQFMPNEGENASQRTEVKVIYGDNNLYIGVKLFDENPSLIENSLDRRDEYNRADWFLVSIDSYLNRRSAYTFGVNAAGVQFDALRTSSSGGGGGGGSGSGSAPPGMDTSWNAIWDSAVRINEEGWIVEMKIPYSMLRFPKSENQTWGIHFTRRIPRLGETSEWPLVRRADRSNLMAQFGELNNIRNIQPRPDLQIRPYTVGGLNLLESEDNPGKGISTTNLDVGGDVKIGLGTNMTLDMTINPDFGQVESDPAVLNLTAFETVFDERRPFFVEGMQIFEFSAGPGRMLYTRRIGAGEPIIGAAKLSGRTAKGTSIGILGATVGHDFSPSRNFGVLRASQQVGSFSEAGVIFTGYDAPSGFEDTRLQSLTGGANIDIRFFNNRYSIEGYSAFTHRSWTNNQENLSGFAGKFGLRKRQGILSGSTSLDWLSKEFNPNDIGRLRENNFIASVNRLSYQINEGRSFGSVRRGDLEFSAIQKFSFDEFLNLGLNFSMEADFSLMNFQEFQFELGLERPFGGYDIYETRGLGAWERPQILELIGSFESDQRKNWQIRPEIGFLFHQNGGIQYSFELGSDVNIGSRVSLMASLKGEWENGVTAWVSNEAFMRNQSGWLIGEKPLNRQDADNINFIPVDDGAILDRLLFDEDQPISNIYQAPIFGDRNTRSFDFTLRSTTTFTSKISLQLYSQSFLARGRYNDFKLLASSENLEHFTSYPKRSEFTLSKAN